MCIGVVAPFSTEEAIVAGPLLAAVEEVVAASGQPVRVIARDDGRDPVRAAEAVAAILAEPGCIGSSARRTAAAPSPPHRWRRQPGCRWSCRAPPPTSSRVRAESSSACARRIG